MRRVAELNGEAYTESLLVSYFQVKILSASHINQGT